MQLMTDDATMGELMTMPVEQLKAYRQEAIAMIRKYQGRIKVLEAAMPHAVSLEVFNAQMERIKDEVAA